MSIEAFTKLIPEYEGHPDEAIIRIEYSVRELRGLAAIKAAQPSGYIIEEVSSGGYSVGGAGGSGAISDERDYKALYLDLIMQVAKKYPGETRHDTAKKYIRFCETPVGEGRDQAAAQEGK